MAYEAARNERERVKSREFVREGVQWQPSVQGKENHDMPSKPVVLVTLLKKHK